MPRVADPLSGPKLLKAARAVFARKGLRDARVEDIAREAGLAKGSFYLHFGTKEEAFLRVVDAFLADVTREAESYHCHISGCCSTEQWREAIRDLDGKMLRFLWANRDVLRMLESAGSQSRLLDAFLDAQAAQIAQNIRVLQQQGVYRREVDAEACAWVVTGGWYNLGRRLAQLDSRPDFDSWAASMHALFLDGLVVR